MSLFIAPIGTPSPWDERRNRLRRAFRCHRLTGMFKCRRLRFHRGPCETGWRSIGFVSEGVTR